jgi:hypothetical protein
MIDAKSFCVGAMCRKYYVLRWPDCVGGYDAVIIPILPRKPFVVFFCPEFAPDAVFHLYATVPQGASALTPGDAKAFKALLRTLPIESALTASSPVKAHAGNY